MPKKCIYTNPDQLPETMQMSHVENALGVARATAYKRVKESDFPCFQGNDGEAIRVNKNAFLNFFGYVPFALTQELSQTPLIWDVEDIAAYMNVCIDTAYEMCRKKGAPVRRVGKRRIKVCREAWLVYIGYSALAISA